ncbi:hypothetical protein ACLOJK_034356 [Asimina triloba]
MTHAQSRLRKAKRRLRKDAQSLPQGPHYNASCFGSRQSRKDPLTTLKKKVIVATKRRDLPSVWSYPSLSKTQAEDLEGRGTVSPTTGAPVMVLHLLHRGYRRTHLRRTSDRTIRPGQKHCDVVPTPSSWSPFVSGNIHSVEAMTAIATLFFPKTGEIYNPLVEIRRLLLPPRR